MSLSLVRTDYFYRYHLYVDPQAAKYDAFRVELLEQAVLLTGDTPEALWQEVQTELLKMRGQYEQRPLYHSLVFAPFARIIALDSARESANLLLKMSMATGELHPLHEERVRALGRAVDALEFLWSKPSARKTVQ